LTARVLILLLGLALPMRAAAQDGEPPVGRIEAQIELPSETPYVGEPLRLVIRSSVRGRVLLDHIIQPSLVDFDWQQFGVDSSSEEMIEGFWTPVVTRVLMVYPLRAGRLTIPPFLRRIVWRIDETGRSEAEFSSAPVDIEARARDALGQGSAFLPARGLRIADAWDPEPDRIPFGQTAQRVVTVEADGITADRLPPLPIFRAPGVITFAAPVERNTILTDQGPVGRAVYRWSVRPVSMTSAFAPAIRIAWFDVTNRRMREALAPERRVAYADTAREAPASKRPAPSLLAGAPLLAALTSFFASAALVVLVATGGRSLLPARAPAALARLRRAARAGDRIAFRRALDELARADGERWRAMLMRADTGPPLAALDAALYGRAPEASLALGPLARAILAAWRDSADSPARRAHRRPR
jgi:hypothetical protein